MMTAKSSRYLPIIVGYGDCVSKGLVIKRRPGKRVATSWIVGCFMTKGKGQNGLFPFSKVK